MWGNVTVTTPDVYGGADLTGKVIYRVQGTTTWKDVSGGGTFNANPGDVIEYYAGISTSDGQDEPFGSKGIWTVPCKSYPTLEVPMIDDSVEGDLVVTFTDPEDNNVISTSDPIDIDNGDIFSIPFKIATDFEEDYGNEYCGADGVMVFTYQTANLTDLKLLDKNGSPFPTTAIPTLDTSSASGYTQRAFSVPAIKGLTGVEGFVRVDATGSGVEPSGTIYNITWSLYDSDWFVNNDISGSPVQCGPEDEDHTDVGSLGAGTGFIYITQAS